MVDISMLTTFFTTTTYITIIVEFALGFGLGYFLGKFVRALLGLIVVGLIGVALNYTQFTILSNTIASQLGLDQAKFVDVITTVILFLGATVLAPMLIGVIIGFLVGR